MAINGPITIHSAESTATGLAKTIDLKSVNGTGYEALDDCAIGGVWTSGAATHIDFSVADLNSTTNVVTVAAHGGLTGDLGQITTTGNLPHGLSLLTNYWLIKTGDNTFKFASSAANALLGTAVDITEDTHTLTPVTAVLKTFTSANVAVATEIVTINAHGWVDGQKGLFTTTGWLPKPLALATEYWVIRDGANTVKFASSLSDASAGTAINLVNDTHTLTPTVAVAKTFVDADVTLLSDEIAIAAHGYVTGQKVNLTTDGVLPTGLVTPAWVIRIGAGIIQLAGSLADASAGTPLNITAAAGGGNHTITPVAVVLSTFGDFDTDPSTNTLTVAAHGYPPGQQVALTTAGTLPGGLAAGNYYIIAPTAGTVQLATTLAAAVAGTPDDITSAAGFGTHTFTPTAVSVQTFTDFKVNVTTDVISLTGHGLPDGQKVVVTTSGVLPTGLVTPSWVIATSADTLQLAGSLADAVAATQSDVTACAGFGDHTFTATAVAGAADIQHSLDGTTWMTVPAGFGGTSQNIAAVAQYIWCYSGPCRYLRLNLAPTAGRLTGVTIKFDTRKWYD